MCNFSYYAGTFLVGANRFGVPFPKLETFSKIFWALPIDYSLYEKAILEIFVYLFIYEVTTAKKLFFFLQCSQIAIRLICKRVIFAYFSSNIPLYIAKNPVEKLCKALEMKLKTYTSVGLKFVFEKIKFKVLHYIQLNFNRQRPGLSKVQTSMFKSLVINYFILNYRHTF